MIIATSCSNDGSFAGGRHVYELVAMMAPLQVAGMCMRVLHMTELMRSNCIRSLQCELESTLVRHGPPLQECHVGSCVNIHTIKRAHAVSENQSHTVCFTNATLQFKLPCAEHKTRVNWHQGQDVDAAIHYRIITACGCDYCRYRRSRLNRLLFV